MAAPDANYKTPAYTTEELETRIVDGSLDLNRMGASLAELQVTVSAIANWINKQASPQTPAPPSPPPPPLPPESELVPVSTPRSRKG